MKYEELQNFLKNIGKDPSHLIFEDELTGIYNRRFLLNYFQYKVPWNTLEAHPVSLIMMDVDHFKQINDTYGHHVGDQTLIWVAVQLKEIAGEESLAIRYAGDEFMILMPHKEKKSALRLGEFLLQRVHEQSVRIDESNQEGNGLHISFSIGVASAPEDAQTGKGLIQMADTALYYAKKTGRDRLANAAEIIPQEVFPKTALYQLEEEKIAGRRQQLAQVSDLLEKFSQGQNQFLIVQGSAGMGKSTFLETIRRNLHDNKKIRLAKVNGNTQESFSPYYLTTRILIELLNLREDGGIGVFEKLSAKEIAYLANILPQLGDLVEVPLKDEPKAIREGVYNALLHFIPQVIESNPLVLLIDDLHFIDEASLVLLRQFFLSRQFPLFICGTSRDPGELKLEAQESPLEIFYVENQQALDIRKIQLTPLIATEIADHLQGVFPQIQVPPDFERYLEQITQGNPLFLGEILHQLVTDQKITLMGQQWVMQPLTADDLPKSLDEIISQRISALDEESRGLLHQASTFGEGVSLSLLTGGSEKGEARVLDFIDQAVAKGLLSSDYQLNDETIRFRGKRIQEITDQGIQPEQKQKLHERIGNYQETLYQKHLLPSAASLAYHFKRSANQEKARTYERVQAGSTQRIFNASEAMLYPGATRVEVAPPAAPLDPVSLAQVPIVIRCLVTSLRNVKLYPPGSEAVVSANRQVKEAIDPILAKNESLAIFKLRQALMINGQKMDYGEYKLVVEIFSKLLDRVELQGIVFRQGLTDKEVEVFLDSLVRIKPQIIDRDYWQSFSAKNQLVHINLQQVQYTVMVERDRGARLEGPAPEKAAPRRRLAQLMDGEQKLNPEDWAQIPDIMRALLNATKGIKIYPLNSQTIVSSIQQLLDSLQPILTKRHVFTLAQVSNALVVNGVKIDTTGIETVVEGVRKFLDSVNLNSLTFLQGLSTQELSTFLGALAQLPTSGVNQEFWARFSREKGLTSILFDQLLYENLQATAQVISEETETVEDLEAVEELEEEAEGPAEPAKEGLDAFLKALPGRVNDLLLEGKEKQAKQMFQRLFKGFKERPNVTREKIVESCSAMMEDLTLAVQRRYAKLLADPLRGAFEEEKDPKVLREISALLHRMSSILIQFAEYPSASRILGHLSNRHRQLEGAKDPHAQRLAKILERKLEPTLQKLLMDDLLSGETSRRENAALLLGSLGRVSIPLLIEVIKKSEELRVRQLAANLLGQLGSEGAELLKRELVMGGKAEERSRILEVIDTITPDLKTELACALGDGNNGVRQAAFRLAERLNDNQVVNLLLDYAKSPETPLAVEAIDCLGRLKPAVAVKGLVSLLGSSKEEERLIACCRALGQIGDPASIEPLAKILAPRGFFSRRKGRGEVRTAAIYALGQIPHPQVAKVLAPFVTDPDPRVREIAQTHVNSRKLPAGNPPVKE